MNLSPPRPRKSQKKSTDDAKDIHESPCAEAPPDMSEQDHEESHEDEEAAPVSSEKIWQPILGALMVSFFVKLQSCTR